MKRKLATLLTLALSTTMLLGGCGGSSGKETTPKSIVDSKERTITYVTEHYEKDSKPKKVVVFENGVATLYDTGDYTMGDFAQMTDDEVVENLMAIIEEKNNAELETWQESLAKKQSDMEALKALKANPFSIQNNETCGVWLERVIDGDSIDYDSSWSDAFFSYCYKNLTDVNYEICRALYYNLHLQYEDELFGQGTSLAEDWQNYMARHEGEKFAPIFEDYIDTSTYNLADVQAATKLFDTVIAEGIQAGNDAVVSHTQKKIDSLQQDIDSDNQKIEELQNKEVAGESYSTVVNLITDGSGNNVQFEAFAMLGEESIEYAVGLRDIVYSEDSRKPIYDSQYAVYGVTTDGSNIAGFLLIRDNSKNGAKFGIDTLETKGVYIDAKEYSDFAE